MEGAVCNNVFGMMHDTRFITYSRFGPHGFMRAMLRPRKAWHALFHPPVAIQVAGSPADRFATIPSVVRWTYDRPALGHRLCLRFDDPESIHELTDRWRLIAHHLWTLVLRQPEIAFHDVAVDLGDGLFSDLPDTTFRFARRPGDRHPLLPNPYLLRRRGAIPRPVSWEKKVDTLYFRGSTTGSQTYEKNDRVKLCRLAKSIEDTDCLFSQVTRVAPDFGRQVREEGLLGTKHPLATMGRFRWIVDVDGNTSSWDRYFWIGVFASVPIRFETRWEESWHPLLKPNENFLGATAETLPDVVATLRHFPKRGRQIAQAAHDLVSRHLNAEAVHQAFEEAWLKSQSVEGTNTFRR